MTEEEAGEFGNGATEITQYEPKRTKEVKKMITKSNALS